MRPFFVEFKLCWIYKNLTEHFLGLYPKKVSKNKSFYGYNHKNF
jgi:hypothetical protein